MANQKIYQDEKGNYVVKLPVEGVEMSFRSPKGKDLKKIEIAARDAEATNVGLMAFMASLLSVSKVTQDEIEEKDAEDLMAIGEALNSFRALRRAA